MMVRHPEDPDMIIDVELLKNDAWQFANPEECVRNFRVLPKVIDKMMARVLPDQVFREWWQAGGKLADSGLTEFAAMMDPRMGLTAFPPKEGEHVGPKLDFG